MNVIIANKYKDALSNLNIDVIKRMDGEFEVETITDTFANFYFNRMILDITAIKNHFDISTIQRLIATIDATKIILFLEDDPRINNTYLSRIISLGIYNFTRELSGVTYLMDNPNSYRDVAQYHDLANGSVPSSQPVGVSPFPQGPMPAQNGPMSFTNHGGQNEDNNSFVSYSSPPKSYDIVNAGSTLVIGFKSLSGDAGSTSLIYMLKKQLVNHKVLAMEINNNDFSYFNDPELISTQATQVDTVKNKFPQFDIVLIDINNSNLDTDGTCNEVIYLLEPSTIKLNTLMRRDRLALEKIKDRKIVLNKSMLTSADVKEFEYEAKVPIFYNIPPLDERKDSQMILDSFLVKLGVYSSTGSKETKPSGTGSIFDLFKKN